jgi:hypothetical protein
VRGLCACARPFAAHVASLRALGSDHAPSSTFSRNLGSALRCLWLQGIDPLTPRPLSPKGERGECRNSRPRPFGLGCGRSPLWGSKVKTTKVKTTGQNHGRQRADTPLEYGNIAGMTSLWGSKTNSAVAVKL